MAQKEICLSLIFITLKRILQRRIYVLLYTVQLVITALIVLLSAIVLAKTISNLDLWSWFCFICFQKIIFTAEY